jgi:hypothetical protein
MEAKQSKIAYDTQFNPESPYHTEAILSYQPQDADIYNRFGKNNASVERLIFGGKDANLNEKEMAGL